MLEAMKVLIDMKEVGALCVQDHTGRVHAEVEEDARPYPFCMECQREVRELQAFSCCGALVFIASCHGESDVVQFICEEDGVLIARPVFTGTPAERRQLIEQLRTWATDPGAVS
jgi:hypothetical protein